MSDYYLSSNVATAVRLQCLSINPTRQRSDAAQGAVGLEPPEASFGRSAARGAGSAIHYQSGCTFGRPLGADLRGVCIAMPGNGTAISRPALCSCFLLVFRRAHPAATSFTLVSLRIARDSRAVSSIRRLQLNSDLDRLTSAHRPLVKYPGRHGRCIKRRILSLRHLPNTHSLPCLLTSSSSWKSPSLQHRARNGHGSSLPATTGRSLLTYTSHLRTGFLTIAAVVSRRLSVSSTRLPRPVKPAMPPLSPANTATANSISPSGLA